MRVAVVFAVIFELQRFWVFADPKSSYKEPLKETDGQGMYKDQAWLAAEARRLQRGFLPSSSSRDYAAMYQARKSPSAYRPQQYSNYMQGRAETSYTCPFMRPDFKSQRNTQVVYRPQDSKYKQFSASPRSYSLQGTKTHYNPVQTPQVNAEGYQVVNEGLSASPRSYSRQEALARYSSQQTPQVNAEGYQVVNEGLSASPRRSSALAHYNSQQTPQVNADGYQVVNEGLSASPRSYSRQEAHAIYSSQQAPQINAEGYQVVNEDPGLQTVVVSSSDQFSQQPQVITIRDNGQAYTSNQGPAIAYKYAEPSRGSVHNPQTGSERRMSQAQQPEMQYRSRHSQHSSAPHVVSQADASHRIEVPSNRQVNQ